MSKFDELLGELETLAKAQPADDGDEKIVAAAAEGGGQGAGEPDGDEDEEGLEGEGKGGAPMAKSFKVTLADGTEMDAQDGTALVKSLQDRIEASEDVLGKALSQAVSLIKSQGEQIAALAGKVKALGGEGKGRKALVSIADKPGAGTSLAKSDGGEGGLSPEEFMMKALDAQKAGRITGADVSIAEAHLNRGQPVPANIIAGVLKA